MIKCCSVPQICPNTNLPVCTWVQVSTLHGSLLGSLEPVIYSQCYLPHIAVVRIRWRRVG